MSASGPNEVGRDVHPPFIGREKVQHQFRQLHARGRHVLLVGPAGVGKSALLGELCEPLHLAICPACDTMRHVHAALEAALGLPATDLRLPARKRRLLEAIATAGRTIVFDGVGHTTPKLSAFLEGVMERASVWIATRSDRARDIGHFWRLLVRFERIELGPFRPAKTRQLLEWAVRTGLIPTSVLDAAGWLHRQSRGLPGLLRALIAELAARPYDLTHPLARRRLELDRRLHELFPASSASSPADAPTPDAPSRPPL